MKWKVCGLWRCLRDPTLHLFSAAVAGRSSTYSRLWFSSSACRYVDNLTFVLSTGQVLGGEEQTGGDGGGLKHTLARLQPKFNVTNMHLQGVKGKVVRSQGVNLITNVTFIYKVAADKQMESKDMEVREMRVCTLPSNFGTTTMM